MSWSSDIRCLYCDGKLPLYKNHERAILLLTHRKVYWQEQERLGVERLHETHDSLRAFRPMEGVEAVLGYLPTYPLPEPPPSGLVASGLPPQPEEPPVAEPFIDEAPLWAPQIAADEHIQHEIQEQEIEPPAGLAGFIPAETMPQPRWPMDRLVIPRPCPLAATGPIWIPLRSTAALIRDVLTAGAAAMPFEPRP